MRRLTGGLARVNAVRLSGRDPRDSSKQRLETVGDIAGVAVSGVHAFQDPLSVVLLFRLLLCSRSFIVLCPFLFEQVVPWDSSQNQKSPVQGL